MNWSHFAVAVVLLVIGYYLGAKNPGLITKLSGGVVTA